MRNTIMITSIPTDIILTIIIPMVTTTIMAITITGRATTIRMMPSTCTRM